MVTIKDNGACAAMREAGRRLAGLFEELDLEVVPGKSTAAIDSYIAHYLQKYDLVSQTLGYHGYRHVSCISLDDEVVHGVPSDQRIINEGMLVKVDVCAAWKGYCADMARCFVAGKSSVSHLVTQLITTASQALHAGIEQALPQGRLGDISHAIQQVVEGAGFNVVRDFAGHGIGKRMHEEPEILNYGTRGKGMIIRSGMAFAIEPMLTAGKHDIYISSDGWTVHTKDRSLAAHVEDTVLITDQGPEIITRAV